MSEIVNSPAVVNESEKRNLKHSFFPLSQSRFTTEIFGLVKPHIVLDGVSDDHLRFRCPIQTRSYTLKAPLMQDVHRRTSYVKVDLPAILPFNFDKFFTNPIVGEDVPNDVSCAIPSERNFFGLLSSYVRNRLSSGFEHLITDLSSSNVWNETFEGHLTDFVKNLIFGELFYSRGSLLSSLGCRISSQLLFLCSELGGEYRRYVSFDRFFDACMSAVKGLLDSLNTGGTSPNRLYGEVVIDSKRYSFKDLSFNAFLDLIRDTSDWSFVSPSQDDVYFDNDITIFNDLTPSYKYAVAAMPFNFGRVCAYQLAVAEFMTNDHVDNIYNAELFRQYIGSLIMKVVSNSATTFVLNGVTYRYDYLSGHFLRSMLISYSTAVLSEPEGLACLQYFLSLFGYRRSLRFKDYFVSSRVSPLAVGDVNVNVVSNQVNVVDISRNIQRQRFFNRVNHIGRDLRNYIRGIFGVEIQPDRHVPHYLVDFDEKVYVSEVENTAEAQQTKNNSITATFSGNTGNKEVEVFVDVPCYIIGLQSYDIERTYIDNIERSFFIKDRYDMFVPELQFVGDQPVYAHELNASDNRAFGDAFGYQYRDMQYKLMIPASDGGFVEFLPGYNFMYQNEVYGANVINSSFIRSLPAELDGFYLSMTGFSLASRFHFISKIDNIVDASRPMIANPNILE